MSIRGPSGVRRVFIVDLFEVPLGVQQVSQSVTIVSARIFVQLLGVKTFSSYSLVDVI